MAELALVVRHSPRMRRWVDRCQITAPNIKAAMEANPDLPEGNRKAAMRRQHYGKMISNNFEFYALVVLLLVQSLALGRLADDDGILTDNAYRMGELEPWIDENFVRTVWYNMGEQVNVKMIRDKFSG